jgi:hypothetical protein
LILHEIIFISQVCRLVVVIIIPVTTINQRMLGRIPETYDLRKIMEALIQELVKEDILHRSQVDFIIEKGKPKSQASIEQKY